MRREDLEVNSIQKVTPRDVHLFGTADNTKYKHTISRGRPRAASDGQPVDARADARELRKTAWTKMKRASETLRQERQIRTPVDSRAAHFPQMQTFHCLQMEGRRVVYHKSPPLAQGGFAQCYVGMYEGQEGQPPEPCLVRISRYSTDLEFTMADGADNGTGTTGWGNLLRENYIAQQVSPLVYTPLCSGAIGQRKRPDAGKHVGVYPLLDGDLSGLAKDMSRADVPAAALVHHFLWDIAPKLATMHKRFIHNDIKTNNFLVRRVLASDRAAGGAAAQSTFTYEIADFGFAHVIGDHPQDQPYKVCDDHKYRNALNGAEESLNMRCDDPSSDIFSLGLQCIQMLTGSGPFSFMANHVRVVDGRHRRLFFDLFEAAREQAWEHYHEGKPAPAPTAPLQRRFANIWKAVYEACGEQRYLADLINQMCTKTYSGRMDMDLETGQDCWEYEPNRATRPDASEIFAVLDQNRPTPRQMARLNAAALPMLGHDRRDNKMDVARKIAAQKYELVAHPERYSAKP